MPGILMGAFVLMALLKVINDDEIGLVTSILVVIGSSIGTLVLGAVSMMVMGDEAGFVVGVVAGAALVGVLVSAVLGIELKRSFTIGGLYMAINVAVGIALELMFQA